MKRRAFLSSSFVLSAGLAWPTLSRAQSPSPLVAFLSTSTPAAYGRLYDQFRQSLRAEMQGRSVTHLARWAENRLDRLPSLAQELLALKPSVVLTHGAQPVAVLKKATSSVPIVFATSGDPVGQGFVQSFARPGGNITGVAFNDEANKKVYEVIRALMPSATRIATLSNPTNIAQVHHLQDIAMMARSLKFESIVVEARDASAVEAAFDKAVTARAHAMVVTPLAPFIGMRQQIILLQGRFRLPTFWAMGEAVEEGGVASYSFPFEQNYRRAGAIVAKVLQGRPPSEIPVELPTQYEVLVNMTAARSLGITPSQAALMRATRIIE